MAPLRAQILHMTRTLNCRDREMHYFYGARSLSEVFYLEDFLQLEKDFPNFHFHLALDRPDPVADEAGVKYSRLTRCRSLIHPLRQLRVISELPYSNSGWPQMEPPAVFYVSPCLVT